MGFMIVCQRTAQPSFSPNKPGRAASETTHDVTRIGALDEPSAATEGHRTGLKIPLRPTRGFLARQTGSNQRLDDAGLLGGLGEGAPHSQGNLVGQCIGGGCHG
jgi:hypothetical protein